MHRMHRSTILGSTVHTTTTATTAKTPAAVRGAALALAGVLAVLPTLAGSTGTAGPLVVGTGLALAVATGVTVLVLTHLPRRPGPADSVTAARVALTSALAGHVAVLLVWGGPPRTWWIACLAALAAVLDAVDGRVARRTGTASAAGARFDMQGDAAFVAVLAVALVPVAGPGVLLAGGARYVYALAVRLRRPLRHPLPPSQVRRVVAAAHATASVVAVVPVVPVPALRIVLLLTVTAVLWSFARDALAAERRHRRSDQPGPGPQPVITPHPVASR